MLSLTSISAATQQSVALYRLSSVNCGPEKIRKVLGDETNVSFVSIEPRMWQLYIWQIPLLLLNSSIYLPVAGLGVLLWTAAKLQQYVWAADGTKVSGVAVFGRLY